MERKVWSRKRRQLKQFGSLPFILFYAPDKSLFSVGQKMSETMDPGRNTLTKKNIKFSLHIRKFRMEQLQSHI
jgi:hypothetical protein